jgi:DNA-binding MarR family transcriptional regulator
MESGKRPPSSGVPDASDGPRRFVDDYLAYLLAHASHLVTRQFHAQLKPHGVPVPVWRVLGNLFDADGLPVTELARYTLFKQPTLTKVIDRMSRQGLVERRPSQRDRRKVLVYITPKGRTVVSDLLARAKQHERDVLAGYSSVEVERLKAALHTLIQRCGGGRRR